MRELYNITQPFITYDQFQTFIIGLIIGLILGIFLTKVLSKNQEWFSLENYSAGGLGDVSPPFFCL